MEKVVLVNQSTGYLMIDIVNAYVAKYDKVALIAGGIKCNERSLSEKVKVSRIIAYDRSSTVKRLISWIIGTCQIFFLLLLRYRKWRVVYVTNPPMSYLLSLVLRQRFSVIVYDVYPEALQNIGINVDNLLYRIWKRWNRMLFSRADAIYTLSWGMKKLLSEYVSEEKIRVIPNWPASNHLHPIAKKDNPFIVRLGLDKKFIVMYSGNIGYTHKVECIIEVARILRNDSDILFLIIGEGGKKSDIMQLVDHYGLTNCRFLTWQDPSVMPYSLAAADVAVVSLSGNASQVSVPSKTYNLLAVGAPLLCIASHETELYRLVSLYQNGACFDENQIREMANYILELKSQPILQAKLSNNSQIAAREFTYYNAQRYV